MSSTTLDYDLPLAVSLRGGGDVLIWPNRVTLSMEVYPLVEVTRLAIVSAPVAADVDAPGSGLAPALLLQLRDGRAPLFVPSALPDASRMLQAILQLWPELRMHGDIDQSMGQPATPPAHSPNSQGVANGDESHQPVQRERIAATDRILAGFAHLSVFYMPLMVPLILWLALRSGAPYASRQSKQAFCFHVLVLTVVAVSIIPAWVMLIIGGLTVATASDSAELHASGAMLSLSSLICGGMLMFVLAVALSGLGVYGSLQAFMGRPFHYPLLRRL